MAPKILRKVEINMKKIISSILAVLMLVSLCAIFVAADGELATEAQHELTAVAMMENGEFRFIFSMTKAEMATWESIDVEDISDYGYEIAWGIAESVDSTDWTADYKSDFDWKTGRWGYDDNNQLYFQVKNGSFSSEENYAKVKDGSMKLRGGMRNFQGAPDAEAAGKDITKVLYDANHRAGHPDLKVNCVANENGACLLNVVAIENYTPEVPDTDPVTPPATADFSAAIVAVAVLALGATVVVAKKH